MKNVTIVRGHNLTFSIVGLFRDAIRIVFYYSILYAIEIREIAKLFRNTVMNIDNLTTILVDVCDEAHCVLC